MSGRLHAPGWEEAQRAAHRLPLRRIIARRPQYEQGEWAHSVWQIETLECGHEDVTGRPSASKRRCWQCGQAGEQAAQGEMFDCPCCGGCWRRDELGPTPDILRCPFCGEFCEPHRQYTTGEA